MSLEAEVAYLNIIDGIRQNEVPAGFSVHPAPRRCARGRDRDLLMVSIQLTEGAPRDLHDLLVSTYFGTPGSVTAAARATFAAGNARLVDHNRYPPTSGPVQGSLCCAVLRGNDLYVARSGDGQVLVIHPTAVEHFPDSFNEPMPPFGLEPQAEVQYFHTVVSASDLALMATAIPPGLENAPLTNLPASSLESAVARLTRLAGSEASVMVVRFAADVPVGTKTRPSLMAAPLHATAAPHTEPAPVSSDSPVSTEAEQTETTEPVEPSPLAEPAPEHRRGSSLAGIIARVRAATERNTNTEADDIESVPTRAPAAPEPDVESPVDSVIPEPQPANGETAPVQIGEHVYEFEEAPEQEADEEPEEPSEPLGARLRSAVRGFIARLPFSRAGEAVKQGSETLGETLADSSSEVLRRVLPEGTLRPDSSLRVPERVLMAIAIILPIIIALAVGIIYIQRGRNQQYAQYLDQARVEASVARNQPDLLAAKPHWLTTLQWLDQADRLFPNQPDVVALRREAQAAVDVVDNVQRLPLQSLVPGGFGSDAQISEIVVNGNEVYALDATRQAVYRAIVSDNKYVIDRNFQCQLGIVGSVTIKRIVDILWLNTPNIVGQPALMALDDDGDLMYCKPDGTAPEASSLISPDTGWKNPRAAEIYADRLYVFDPGANDIWTYDRVGGVFSDRPKSYFTGQVLDMSNALSFTIAQGEVYILQSDGRMTYCVRDLATLLTNCTENVLYTDTRSGHAGGDRLDDAALPKALFYDPPPEPSIYLLDTASGGVYQLSLKLVLQRVYRSQAALPAPIAALAISTDKDVFVASGNNVYWAGR